MKNLTSAGCLRDETRLIKVLQEFFSQAGLPPSLKPGLKEQEKDWGVAGIGASLEWGLLMSRLRLDPAWPHQDVWCDGVYFFSIEIPRPNLLRGLGYCWWAPTDQAGKGEMRGIEYIEPIELELGLVESAGGLRLDYSIKLWAAGLCHHLTPSGIAVAPIHSAAASKLDLVRLLAVIKDQDVHQTTRREAATLLERFAAQGGSLMADLLSDADVVVRRVAMHGLGSAGLDAQATVPLATRALGDTDLIVRCLAARALWQCAEEDDQWAAYLRPAKHALLEMAGLEYSDYRDWQMSVHRISENALARIGRSDPSLVDMLIEELWKDRIWLRSWLLWSAGSASEKAIRFFTGALKDDNPERRVIAAFSLWRFGIDGGSRFRSVLKDTGNGKIALAAWKLLKFENLLKWIKAEDAAPVLVSIMKERDTDAGVWCLAVATLAVMARQEKYAGLRSPLKSTVPGLLEILSDKDVHLAGQAAKALGEIGAEAREAIPALREIVRDKQRYDFFREEAAEALFKMAPDRDTSIALFDMLLSERGLSRRKAIPAIRHLGAEALPLLVKALQTNDHPRDSCFDFDAFDFIEQHGAAALPGLIELLKAENWRRQAIESLGKTGCAGAVPHLVNFLNDKDPGRRAEAAEALGRLGKTASEAVPVLGEALNDPDMEVCARAAEALGRIGKASVAVLLEASATDDPFMRQWVTRALGDTGSEAPEVVRALALLHHQDDSTIRYLAAEALKRIKK